MLKKIEISGFKSFAKKTTLSFDTPITAIVGPNGSGKSNVVESIRFVLGEQSIKSMRGKGSSDLIWKGSKLLAGGSKARVAISFDNEDRKFAFSNAAGASADLSFDEITLAREVTHDGSDYFINGTGVRLKDITELLGSVNIGSSGHHIISQGEADRLLSASAKDRRGMIEDALGLKVYQLRIRESERKLEKTAANMKEVAALRRELAPHLNFLGKQVEKIKMAEDLRTEFAGLFNTYAALEAPAIAFAENRLAAEEKAVFDELSTLSDAVVNETAKKHEAERELVMLELRGKEGEQSKLVREREELGRAIGRIEGRLDALTNVREIPGAVSVPADRVRGICTHLLSIIDTLNHSDSLIDIKNTLAAMREKVEKFAQSIDGEKAPQADTSELRASIEQERAALETRMRETDERLRHAAHEVHAIREKLAQVERLEREAERTTYAGAARKATLEGMVREFNLRRDTLMHRTALFNESVKEAEALLGTMLAVPQNPEPVEDTPEKTAERETLHRKIERIKIKLEDVGAASGAEIMKEYDDTKERDAFLARELIDLESSIASLRTLIHELRDTIERTFKEGIEKINLQFGEFFRLMFGGGGAFLSIVVEHKRAKSEEEDMGDDDDALPFEHGIEINVSLPHKKVRDLAMLSGGERSLISIALLFAMSQVNPPPFLVLDETDAALDEANSRKYGDMLEHLSKHSKLIVVTHNRETMSRAQVLYGVTMGLEGASKLLSIKFEEAVKIAK